MVVLLLGLGVGTASSVPVVAVLTGVAVLVLAVRSRSIPALCTCAVPVAIVVSVPWPLPALLCVAAACLHGRRRRAGPGPVTVVGRWWNRDADRFPAVAATAAVALLGGCAAYLLVALTLAPRVIVWIAEPSGSALVVGVALISLVNAVGEETLWRGLLASWLDAAGTPEAAVAVVTAVSFGLSHVGGLPSGVAGVIGATALGLVMAFLRRRTGLAACVVVHVVVDAAVLAAVLPRVVWVAPM